jgi:hypothetical protein
MSLALQVELMELDRVVATPAKAAPLLSLPAPQPTLPALPARGGDQQAKTSLSRRAGGTTTPWLVLQLQ